MAQTYIRQDIQIRKSDLYDDTVAAGVTLESAGVNIEDDLNGLRSQMKRVLWDDGAGNWYDDVPTVNAKKRGIFDLNTDLDDIEEKKVLCRVSVLTDVTVTAAQNWELLVVASSEAPTQVAAVALTQDGAVVAKSALNGAGFNVHELIEIAGSNAITPKNLVVVRDSTTGQPIQSGGLDVFGLLQYESTGADGAAFNDTSAGARVKISFVKMNAGLDDLIACPVGDIAGKTINYAYVRRIRFDSLSEDLWLGNPSFVDMAGSVDVTRQNAYTNQGTTAVELTTNADLDLATGLEWAIRDNLNADLLSVFEGSAGGTSEVRIKTGVDVFNVDAIVNDFAEGIRVDSAGQRINIGETAGLIESTTAADLRILGAGELYLDDGNQPGSWAQTSGIKLSDTATEWSDYETEFGGEVSLLRGIYLAATSSSRGTKTYAEVTLATNADVDVGGVGGGTNLSAQLPDMSGGSFLTSFDVYVNGVLQQPGANSGANNDYYPGTSLPNGQLKFEYKLKVNDVIAVIPYA